MKRSKLLTFLLIIFLFPLLISLECNDSEEDPPVVELIITDCPVNEITMTVNTSVSGSPSNWVVKVEVNIKCNDSPVNNAQVRVKYDWLSYSFDLDTDENGDASIRQRVTYSESPSGSVDVTIRGNDGYDTKTYNYP